MYARKFYIARLYLCSSNQFTFLLIVYFCTGVVCYDLQDEFESLVNDTDRNYLRQNGPVLIQTSISHWNKYVNYRKNVCRKDCVQPRQVDKDFAIWESRRVDAEIRRMLSSDRAFLETPEERSRYVDDLVLQMGLEKEAKIQVKVDEEYENLLKNLDKRQYHTKVEDYIINAVFKAPRNHTRKIGRKNNFFFEEK